MPIAFPFQASLNPKEEFGPFLPARALVEQITGHIPEAVADWQAGECKAHAEVDQLIALKLPPVVYEGHRRFRFGNYAEVRIGYQKWPGREVLGYVGSDDPDQGGSTFEIIGDFDVELLKRAAADLSEAIAGYTFSLRCENHGFHAEVFPVLIEDATEYIHRMKPQHRERGEDIEIQPLGNWQIAAHRALTGWLTAEKMGRGYENILRGFGSADAFARAAVSELCAIGEVRGAWWFGTLGYHFGILLDQTDDAKRYWATMIDLHGVARELLNG